MELSVQIRQGSDESRPSGSVAFGTLQSPTLWDFEKGMDAFIYNYNDNAKGFNKWGNSISNIFEITGSTNFQQVIEPFPGDTTDLESWTLYVSKLG